MGLSKVRSDLNEKSKNQMTLLANGDELGVQQSFFGASSDFDIVAWLRGVALDPCNPQASHSSAKKLHKQALNTWKILLMSNNECPRRKRKFELFLKGSNSIAPSRPLDEKSTSQSTKKASRPLDEKSTSQSTEKASRPLDEKSNTQSTKKASSASCVSYTHISSNGAAGFYESIACKLGSGGMLVIEDNFQGKPMNANLTCLDNGKSLSPSDSLSSGIYMTPQQAVELLIATGECPRRPSVPIGPHFQAHLPDWTGGAYGNDDSETLKWLGTQCWPRRGVSTPDRPTNAKAVGKGRPASCFCISPGSAKCIRCHISEARRRLKSNLGPAFETWGFHEMGDVVSGSWPSSEQEAFQSLVQANPMNTSVDFWKRAKKSFPKKSKKVLVSYYYNAFIPRRMSLETRSSDDREVVSDVDMLEDSDEDEQDEEKHEKVQKFLKSYKR